VIITPIDEYLIFKIVTPKGSVISIPKENMPEGWQQWNCPIEEIAERACKLLGLKVTVEMKEVCTATP
jgi:hypothetical protein